MDFLILTEEGKKKHENFSVSVTNIKKNLENGKGRLEGIYALFVPFSQALRHLIEPNKLRNSKDLKREKNDLIKELNTITRWIPGFIKNHNETITKTKKLDVSNFPHRYGSELSRPIESLTHFSIPLLIRYLSAKRFLRGSGEMYQIIEEIEINKLTVSRVLDKLTEALQSATASYGQLIKMLDYSNFLQAEHSNEFEKFLLELGIAYLKQHEKEIENVLLSDLGAALREEKWTLDLKSSIKNNLLIFHARFGPEDIHTSLKSFNITISPFTRTSQDEDGFKCKVDGQIAIQEKIYYTLDVWSDLAQKLVEMLTRFISTQGHKDLQEAGMISLKEALQKYEKTYLELDLRAIRETYPKTTHGRITYYNKLEHKSYVTENNLVFIIDIDVYEMVKLEVNVTTSGNYEFATSGGLFGEIYNSNHPIQVENLDRELKQLNLERGHGIKENSEAVFDNFHELIRESSTRKKEQFRLINQQ
ncbi:MAG: hypothetical protein ABIH82_01560 [Candidatus Woesearchaeota archaeon]